MRFQLLYNTSRKSEWIKVWTGVFVEEFLSEKRQIGGMAGGNSREFDAYRGYCSPAISPDNWFK